MKHACCSLATTCVLALAPYLPGGFDAERASAQAWADAAGREGTGLERTTGLEQEYALARALGLAVPSSDPLDILSTLMGLSGAHDLTPPAPVSDLQVTAISAASVTLSWTATGDDGLQGVAAAYELRVSSEPITADNFVFATSVLSPAPGEAGTLESVTIAVPPDSTVYFALVVRDDEGNGSELSNVVEATTSSGSLVYTEDVEQGLAGWTADGLWHVTTRRAAKGTSSAWYGQERTGDFDTGAANAGELTSPVISLAGVQNPVLVFFELLDVEEPPWDSADVIVYRADEPDSAVVFAKVTGNTQGEFQPRVLPIPDFAGADIRIRFRFDTMDDIANRTEGWYVDDIRIISDDRGGDCAHELCDQGEPLGPSCDPCVETVCEWDPFCCESEWDSICVDEAQELCGLTCDACGDGECGRDEDCTSCPQDCGACVSCEHELCEAGAALEPQCDECVGIVCEGDPFCCETEWDSLCVDGAQELCGLTCETCGDGQCGPDEDCASCPQDCGACVSCEHELCEVGAVLDPQCDECVGIVCEWDPFCCESEWDSLCVGGAQALCGLTCDTRSNGQRDVGEARAASCEVSTGRAP